MSKKDDNCCSENEEKRKLLIKFAKMEKQGYNIKRSKFTMESWNSRKLLYFLVQVWSHCWLTNTLARNCWKERKSHVLNAELLIWLVWLINWSQIDYPKKCLQCNTNQAEVFFPAMRTRLHVQVLLYDANKNWNGARSFQFSGTKINSSVKPQNSFCKKKILF